MHHDLTIPGIQVTALTKRYADFLAVDQISFAVDKGSIVGLLGPNGAGKTTTLRMLAGILRPTSGTISICGFDGAADPMEVKKRIGFLSGDTQLYERLTVREILRLFGRLHQLPDDLLESRIETLIRRLEMTPFADRRVGTLSSGQAQRANIARTIIHDPAVLILDEVTVSLDIISSQFMLEILREFRAESKAILFSTHIMSEAEFLCDRIDLIHGGTIIDSGTATELVSKTGAANLTAAFLSLVKAHRRS